MITEIILYENPYADLAATLESILASQAWERQLVRALIVDVCQSATEDEKAAKLIGSYPDRIKIYEYGADVNQASKEVLGSAFAGALQAVTEKVDTPYAHILFAGDILADDPISSALACFEADKTQDGKDDKSGRGGTKNCLQIVTLASPETKQQVFVDAKDRLSLSKRPFAVPMDLGMLFFRTAFLREVPLTSNLRFLGEYVVLAGIYQRNEMFAIAKTGSIVFRSDHVQDFDRFSISSQKAWYEEIVTDYTAHLTALYDGKLPAYAQYMLFYLIRLCFLHNLNHRDKHVYHTGYEEFLEKCQKAFSYIGDEVIANVNEYERFLLDHMTVIYYLKIKYGGEDCFGYITEASRGHIYLNAGNLILANVTAQDVRIDVLEEEEKEYVMECSTRIFTRLEDFMLHCRIAGVELPIEVTKRYCHHKYFGHSVDKRHTFRVRVPKSFTKRRAALAFYSEFQGQWHVLKICTLRHTARLNSEMHTSFCVLGDCFVDFREDNKRLFFTPYNKRAHASRERRYLQELKKISKELYDLRVAYWKSYPKYGKKNIWFTFDKLYKGGDCGEYFYKYVKGQKDGVDIEYLITEGVADDKRLRSEGYRPMHYGTREHKIKFLYASVVAATHPNIGLYGGMSQEQFAYFADLFRAKVVCIQHGLAVQKLAFNVNQVYDNTRAFYAASKYEIQNLSHPIYGYREDMLKLTGIPRFDGLKSDNKKQILIAPTWRSYIAMPPSMGSARPYSPTFHETDYFKIYQSLIDDTRLREAAKKHGYRILYLLHPTTASQLGDYRGNEAVEILSPVGVSYEQLLTQSDLMVTDYSGIQFDFAYMRKPIIYYHPDKLPPHYDEGGFIYDTQGFGEIVRQQKELVDLLISYMEKSCRMNEFYQKRADDFFAFKDDRSCERIYRDLMGM